MCVYVSLSCVHAQVENIDEVAPLVPPPPPPYSVLVPPTPTPANSSAFPSREPKACLPRNQSSDHVNQGMQFDIHGDAIIDQMVPIPVSVPQPPTISRSERNRKWS